MRNVSDSSTRGQVLRYIVNGLVATAVHYSILRFNLKVVGMPSAGVANAIAAMFGITVSFLGSRYFVFRASSGGLARQGLLFVLSYGLIALLHGLILYLWTDRAGLDYTLGFLVATVMQVACSFVINKFMVFR